MLLVSCAQRTTMEYFNETHNMLDIKTILNITKHDIDANILIDLVPTNIQTDKQNLQAKKSKNNKYASG